MRGAILVGVALAGLSGPALAGDLGIPIDVLPGQFVIRAGVSKDPVNAADPDCLARTACTSDLGLGVTMLMGTGPDIDTATEVKIVSSPTPAGAQRFNDGCIALVGLLSPEVPAGDRRTLLHEMNYDALAQGTATRLVSDRIRYDIALRDDMRLVFTAKR